ncbi:MAG: hypothetical protein ABI566_04250 [Pseudolysinimonas sp.]
MKILFFSPFANIWEHAFPEGLIAESFAAKDVEVVAVRCAGMLKVHCVAMSAVGVGPDAPLSTREEVCRACTKRRDLITKEMNFPALIMDAWLQKTDIARVDELVASVDATTWTGLEVDGVPLGRYAVYEMWLSNKLVDTHLSPEMWSVYVGQLRNTLMTYFAARRILEHQAPDAVVVYNDHYSVNHAFCAAAWQLGIPSYTIHGGQHMVRRGESMMMFRSDYGIANLFESAAWEVSRDLPIGADEVALVGDHFTGLLQASSAFAYSSKFMGTGATELRTQLGIAPGAKVLLATMSSEDELIGVRLIDAIHTSPQVSLFADQFDWVDNLFRYAVSHPEVHLVLRLHPRMFPNKREQVLSPVVTHIMALRDNAPANVTFNMPSDGIGLYDLMQIVDLLLNYSSSVGAELAAFGIPVVTPSNADFFTYPGELNRIGHTLDEFHQQIEAALAEGWSIENVRRAFRWYAFLFGRVAVDFSDAVRSRPVAIRPKKPGRMLKLYNWAAFIFLQHGPLVRERLALRRRALSAHSSDVLFDVIDSRLDSASDSALWPARTATFDDETAALRGYLRALSETLWTGIDEPDSLAGRVRAALATDAVGTR